MTFFHVCATIEIKVCRPVVKEVYASFSSDTLARSLHTEECGCTCWCVGEFYRFLSYRHCLCRGGLKSAVGNLKTDYLSTNVYIFKSIMLCNKLSYLFSCVVGFLNLHEHLHFILFL